MQNSVEERLRLAMAELAHKNVEKISVSSLCKKAEVSRASFYIYYKDLDDLIVKTREYIINKLCEQLNIILDIKNTVKEKQRLVLSNNDIELLKGFLGKHVYWEFAFDANRIIAPRYKKLIVERYGEAFYNEKKEIFEFLLNGGVASLCIDLVFNDKESYIKNMDRVAEIAKDLLLN